jgi:hypothetical protein
MKIFEEVWARQASAGVDHIIPKRWATNLRKAL